MSALASSNTNENSKGKYRQPVFRGGFVGLPLVCPAVPKKQREKVQGNQMKKMEKIEQIKLWVIEIIKDSTVFSEENIIVLEVECFDPGCVPIETVVMLSRTEATGSTDKPRSQFKILKPCNEVTEGDVAEVFQNVVLNKQNTTDELGNTSVEGAIPYSNTLHAVNCPCCDPYSDYVSGMYGDFY